MARTEPVSDIKIDALKANSAASVHDFAKEAAFLASPPRGPKPAKAHKRRLDSARGRDEQYPAASVERSPEQSKRSSDAQRGTHRRSKCATSRRAALSRKAVHAAPFTNSDHGKNLKLNTAQTGAGRLERRRIPAERRRRRDDISEDDDDDDEEGTVHVERYDIDPATHPLP
ncbi:unnamed protein product [Parajaminaea phylloscopi]